MDPSTSPQRMSSRESACPHGAPDAARDHDADGAKVRGESQPAARGVRPEHDPDAERDREQQPREDAEAGGLGARLLDRRPLRRGCAAGPG